MSTVSTVKIFALYNAKKTIYFYYINKESLKKGYYSFLLLKKDIIVL